MKPLWLPMSALLDGEIDCWASEVMLRMPLAAGAAVRVRYVGDQMWPAFRHGQSVEVLPAAERIAAGDAVVALCDGNLELWRVERATAAGLRVVGDAATEPPRELERDALIGVVPVSRSRPGAFVRQLRRAWLELGEAWSGRLERPAESVRRKYDQQAEAYAAQAAVEPSAEWTVSIRRYLGQSGRVLVVGSGTGQDCRALAKLGFDCVGLDFSTRMIAQAERLLRDTGLADRVRFRVADVRSYEPEAGAFDAVLFTPDVYSFVPRRAARLAMLRRLAAGLTDRGRLLLDARVVRGGWRRLVLALEWLRAGTPAEFGDSHTRFLSPDGTIHRSFVHCFSERSLRTEYARGGFRAVAVERGFHVLAPNPHRGRPA